MENIPVVYPPYDELSPIAVSAAAAYLDAIGYDHSTPHTQLTPHRLTHYWTYLLAGEGPPHLTVFPNENPVIDNMVKVPSIPFWSACSHHGLPFVGVASIGYIPDKLVYGLSKIPLLVRSLARGFWMQEHLGHVIAATLNNLLSPLGVGVSISAVHTCQLLDLRQPPIPRMITTVLKGSFFNAETRAEFLNSIPASDALLG